ncbi:response regulator transcription factor [Fictibacillus phosphorivorans]|uniref:response regulator transcription factor n=1 Tax=Fictibacillus phosphorivorans TaxID=1221500 RepID=UPI00203D6A74|nr:response regulator [Fictibacillus phosphorivorans]MCM3718083.1 response regulator [Fictibacillus phosphorivorans]MCM3775710.1 response regulator [Fictibacillus phosphorivorans]
MITALIVEDEQMIRKGMMYTIDWKGMQTEIIGEAANGQEGLEKIIALKPDLVITDIKMPILNGTDMIQEASRFHDFETVVLSSYSDFEYTKKCIQLQVFDYLLKPIDEEILKTMMDKLVQKIREKKKQEILQQKMDKSSMKLLFPEKEEMRSYNTYTRKVIESIQSRYAEKINLEDLAQELCVSSSYLSRVFKKDTNRTFNHFLNQQRIQASIPLLLSKQYMMYEIAEKVGFSDYKQYHAVFNKYMGCPPTEFIQGVEAKPVTSRAQSNGEE